ncbi:MAG: hypothetical protein KF712_17935 [Akkermansiaceae bacterium]|nr:hypothetical protein [Akkermansiaceae bacterium]
MKFPHHIIFALLACGVSLAAGPVDKEAVMQQHREGSGKLAEDQDELSADVQQLTIEETVPQVIKLLEEVEGIMDEATDWLLEPDTGGRTIAAQTEIIEKIHAAAKERQKQNGSGQAGGAMMDMMERMMGKEPGQGEGQQQGQPGGDQGGPGNKFGESDTPNGNITGDANEKSVARKVPKAAGSAGKALPEEFHRALDAYNRGAGQKGK